LMTCLLPTVERVFNVQTDLSLIELGDPAHPLLQELIRRAPGTYNHSITVASLAEAAAALGSTHQNVAQIVAALQRKELLQVEPDPADRRRKLLSATNHSAAYWRERDAGDFAAVADWFADLSPDELETFCELSDRVMARLDNA